MWLFLYWIFFFMLKCKIMTDFTNLLLLNNFKDNDKTFFSCFFKNKIELSDDAKKQIMVQI